SCAHTHTHTRENDLGLPRRERDLLSALSWGSYPSLSLRPKSALLSPAISKSRDIASRASTSRAGEWNGISVVCSLPWRCIVIANLATGAAQASGCDTFFCSPTCAILTSSCLFYR